jgi:hypothetical protein
MLGGPNPGGISYLLSTDSSLFLLPFIIPFLENIVHYNYDKMAKNKRVKVYLTR